MMPRALSALVTLAAVAPSAAAAQSAQWITLGTSGGPSVQPERAQISNALVVGDAVYVFDAGNDVQRQLAKAGVPERNLRAVFLSHHHLDHNADVGPLVMTHWLFGRGKLAVVGPKGTRPLVDGVIAANAATALASFPTAGQAKPPIAETVSLREVKAPADPAIAYQDENIRVTAIEVDHYQVPPSVPLMEMPRAIAYRIEAGGRSIVYTGDTGPSLRLRRLAADADLLVTEVVDLNGIAAQIARAMPDVPDRVRTKVVAGMRVNHLTPGEVGRLARESRVKRVVLTHFVPVPEQLTDSAALSREIAASFGGSVALARDLDRF